MPQTTERDEYDQVGRQPPEHSYRNKLSYLGDMPDPFFALVLNQCVPTDIGLAARTPADKYPVLHHQAGLATDWLKQNSVGRLTDLNLEAEPNTKMFPQFLGNDNPAERVDGEFHGK